MFFCVSCERQIFFGDSVDVYEREWSWVSVHPPFFYFGEMCSLGAQIHDWTGIVV